MLRLISRFSKFHDISQQFVPLLKTLIFSTDHKTNEGHDRTSMSTDTVGAAMKRGGTRPSFDVGKINFARRFYIEKKIFDTIKFLFIKMHTSSL